MTSEADPLDLLRNMWGNMGFNLPGMVVPTLDADELDKHITDLKAVEGWLKSNLGLLQMTIQGMEMQRTTLAAMRAMSESAGTPETQTNPFANSALWSWPFMAPPGGTPTDGPAAAATPATTPRKPRKKAG